MQKLLEYQNKKKRKSNRDKTREEESDELPLPMSTVALARVAEKREDQAARTNTSRHQREHETRPAAPLSGLHSTQSGQATGGTRDADGTALVAELHTTYEDQRRREQDVAVLADVVRPGGGQVADDSQRVAFEAFANAVSQVRVSAAHSLVHHQTLIFRVDEDVSRRFAVFCGQTPGGRAAELGRSIAKTMVLSGSSSSFIVWLPVLLVCVKQPFMLEQLFNLYIG